MCQRLFSVNKFNKEGVAVEVMERLYGKRNNILYNVLESRLRGLLTAADEMTEYHEEFSFLYKDFRNKGLLLLNFLGASEDDYYKLAEEMPFTHEGLQKCISVFRDILPEVS